VDLIAPDPPLSDGVVSLRPPREDDLPATERGIVDPDVVRYIGPSDSAGEVLDRNRSRWAEGSGATFSIVEQDDACLGHVWLNLRDDDRASVGYWLLPEARGNGFAVRSVRLISGWAFRDLGLARLEITTEPSNQESQRVARRSGFMEEGILRSFQEIAGRRVDCVIFSLLPGDAAR
jgi:RimJ/RimL family protein N-acetyltransferase